MKTKLYQCGIYFEWQHIPDKARRVSAPQPAINVVTTHVKMPGQHIILREEFFETKKEAKDKFEILRRAFNEGN